MVSPLIREYSGYVPFNPVEYVWFDFASDPIPTVEESDEITRQLGAFAYSYSTPNQDWPLPFEKMSLLLSAMDKERRRTGVFVVTLMRNHDELVFQFWTDSDTAHGSILIRSTGSLKDDFRIAVSSNYARAIGQSVEECQKHGAEVFKVMYRRIMALVLLNKGSPSIAKPTENAAVNAKRRRKGKRPFFEWSTVEIKPRVQANEPAGGTHASPKPHMRRGHVRKLKSGRIVNVKSMIVNKHKMPEQGFIFHDYKVAHMEAVH